MIFSILTMLLLFVRALIYNILSVTPKKESQFVGFQRTRRVFYVEESLLSSCMNKKILFAHNNTLKFSFKKKNVVFQWACFPAPQQKIC